VKKNRVGRSEIFFSVFKTVFPIQVNTLQNQTQLWEFSLNWTKALFPVSIEPLHTCRTAHIFPLVANTKMYSIFLEEIRFFFLRGWIKILGSGLKFRVGQVSRNTTFFSSPNYLTTFLFYGVWLRETDLRQGCVLRHT
jgi:hypothetical protein